MGRQIDIGHCMTRAGLTARMAAKFQIPESRLVPVIAAWARAGILKPEGGPHQGKGVFRLFPESELFKAGLLIELWRYSLPTHQLILARERIDIALKKTPEVFDEARQGARWFFRFALNPGQVGGFGAGEFTKKMPTNNWGVFWDQKIGTKAAPVTSRSAIVVCVDQVLMKL